VEGHRIELQDERRQIEVFVDGVTLASSTRVVVLRETGLPPRYYFPRDDVRMDFLEATPTETVCPFKGQASYWTFQSDTGEHRDLAWSYETPVPGMERIAGLVCFYAERAAHAIDGQRQEPPVSPWSPAKADG
jgi:uncharacterized protein (DUF427 family)